jgi:hypothetical protein
VPKPRESCPHAQAVRDEQPQEQSHFAPLPNIARQRPSNLWGVGYQEAAQALRAMAERATSRHADSRRSVILGPGRGKRPGVKLAARPLLRHLHERP